MYLEIISPETTLFSATIEAVVVPGIHGQFELLNNHAPIVALLNKGVIKIRTNADSTLDEEKLHDSIEKDPKNPSELAVKINSGTIEMKENKVIILAD